MSHTAWAVIVFLVLGVVGGSCYGVAACSRIDAGHVGVSVKKCSGGGVDDKPIPTGYYRRSVFCEDVVEYPVNLQTIIMAEGDEDTTNNSIAVNSIEGLPIAVDLSMSFTLDPAKVPEIYKKYRTTIERITSVFIRQTIREALQSQFAKYTAEQIYAEKKEIVRGEAQKFLTERLGHDGFIVNQFTLNDVRVPEQVTAAIRARVAMTQEAQKAEAEVRKTEALAKQRTAAAQGEAEAMKMDADARAYSIKVINQALTPEYVAYLNAQKWNGALPQVTGGATPLIQLGK